ncbi:tRNA-binding protein [Natronosalvus halobius]|uniref:tRNA-binding protein n=1 Tax=Natronosalvus halobius TaxID=2953746 RepID=UPI0020A0766A|nr:tRNA-binding protein [Natronosalvus halobius]USZ71659.1 tRNA-binding protein [Natronosalvus halobius]
MPESPFDVEIRIGEIVRAESFPEARKPHMTKLWIDIGSGSDSDSDSDTGDDFVRSAGQHDYHYDPKELIGRRVLCATNLGSVRIAGFKSEVLTVGVPSDEGYPVLVTPDSEVDADVPLGGVLY